MKIICTTSNKYLHLIPVFTYLFNRNWGSNYGVTIVGYDKPTCTLPDNFKFESMGVQGTVNEWSTDLRKYFEAQDDDWFIFLMEDTLIKSFDENLFADCCALMMPGVGRIDLTKDVQKREHKIFPGDVVYADSNSRYRLSTQPSIWNKEFLLKYLTDGMTPWEFETQDPKNDEWHVVGMKDYPLKHNEGCRRFDIYKLDLNGFSEEEINHINSLL